MSDLETYKRKRDFSRTPEPEGESPSDSSRRATFVIHKHAARQLHYDLRLEIDGALASWAVPKGPSLDTHDKRLAVHVEDHPLEYGSFEGTIPEGEYGGGTVMIWDRGWWEPIGDLSTEEMLAKGHLKFHLHGDKLDAGWALVRMKPREGEKRENWLLIKERDDGVRPKEEFDVLEARTESAASGRTMEQIATEVSVDSKTPQSTDWEDTPDPFSASSNAVRGPVPADSPMQMARLVDRPPEGDGWLHEIKFDGYRIRCLSDKGRARLIARSGADWTDRFPELAAAISELPVDSILLDGEVIVFGSDGGPDFGALQAALSSKRTSEIVYMAFDLLYMNGWDIREETLRRRKELLRALTEELPADSPIRYTQHVEGRGVEFHREACSLALEGSISKRADRPHVPNRSADWRKVKCLQRQEFVIGGFTEGKGSRKGFGALLLGTYDGEELRYAGRVGTGFDAQGLESIRAKLDDLEEVATSFEDPPRLTGHTVHWVKPELVAEVSFQEWTRDGSIRHPSFHGLRADVPARGVRREESEVAPADDDSGADVRSDAPGSGASSAGSGRKSAAPIEIAGVRITNPTKILYPSEGTPDEGISKAALARYYEVVAPEMLRYVNERPLTLVRCPHGSSADCFYQKHPDQKGFPEALTRVQIPEKGGPQEYFFATDRKGIISLAQLGALEVHVWNSVVPATEKPDQLVFDLDPGPDVEWEQVLSSAELVRDALAALGLASFAKTTGGKGLHVVVPLIVGPRYDDARALARAFVDRITSHDPKAFTAKMAKSARKGRVFIDYLRNAHGATAVAPFSTRARAGAPVSTPVTWEELAEGIDPASLDITTVPKRVAGYLASDSDPWRGFEEARTGLDPALFAALGVPWQEELAD